MLMPKRVKYRKVQRGRMRGNTKGGSQVAFGEYGLKAIDRGWVTNRQIEAARVAMTRRIKRGGKVWINVFPDKPYTKKPAETRMGSGKGNPEGWVAVVKPGRVMFELSGVPEASPATRCVWPDASCRCGRSSSGARTWNSEGGRRARAQRRGSGRAAARGARGDVQPPVPPRHRRGSRTRPVCASRDGRWRSC